METKEQVLNALRMELDKWLKHSVRGMKSGNPVYFQGKITLITDLLYFIHDIDTTEPPSDLEEVADGWYKQCPFPKSTWWDEGKEMKLTDSKETFIAGARWQKEQILSIIESRISEIIGDAQPRPVLRAELQELINKINNHE